MACVSSACVKLASSVMTPHRPTTVLVHGLDSSKQTWTDVLGDLTRAGYPAIAVDLRGHGESPLGDPASFSATALAQDVLAAVREHGVQPGGAVLVGHSMGGRIAMRAAAIDCKSARLFKAVVVEDMDLRVRDRATTDLTAAQQAELRSFESDSGRAFADWASAREALLRWYDGDEARVDSWKGSRVRALPAGRGWWSDLNPAAQVAWPPFRVLCGLQLKEEMLVGSQRLARDRVLASTDGAEAWDSLRDQPTKVYLWYADAPGTVCRVDGPGGIDDMSRRLPTAQVRLFVGSDHSIHRSAREDFVKAVRQVVDS